MLDLEAIKAACARVSTGESRGTAYLVAPGWAVTCKHVVEGVTEASLVFSTATVKVTVRERGESADFVFLELKKKLTGVSPLPLAQNRPSFNDSGLICGFPAIAVENDTYLNSHVIIKAEIRDPRAQDDQKSSAITVYSEDAGAGSGAELGGFSGSPVLVDGVVIGHLHRVLDSKGRAVLGQVYACPVEHVLNAMDEPLRRQILEGPRQAVSRAAEPPIVNRHLLDEMPPSHHFVGRQDEQHRLERWSADANCRGILITGGAGMGKSLLASRYVDMMRAHWRFIIWFSFRDAPLPDRVLTDLLKALLGFFSYSRETSELTGPSDDAERILALLRARPTLLVFDNLETIVDARTGGWLAEHVITGRLIENIAVGGHGSRLVITSQQVPLSLEAACGDQLQVRPLALTKGLDVEDAKRLMQNKHRGIRATPDVWAHIALHYRGNPYALTLVAGAVHKQFDGDLDQLVPHLNNLPFDPDQVDHFLERQFQRLSAQPTCHSLLYWLAVAREPVPEATLRQKLEAHAAEFAPSLTELVSLHLVERTGSAFSLSPQMMGFVTRRLIEKLVKELENGKLDLLGDHSLLWTDANEHVRETQRRLFLRELLRFAGEESSRVDRLDALLSHLQSQEPNRSDYAASNLLNLIIEAARNRDEANVHMNGYDLSALTLRDVQFAGVTVRRAKLSGATLKHCILPEIIGSVVAVACGSECVAAGDNFGKIHVWDTRIRQRLHTLTRDVGWVWALAISPSGKHLVSGHDDGKVCLWTLASGDIRQLEAGERGHRGHVRSLAFLSGGDHLATTGRDGRILIWDLRSHRLLQELGCEPNGALFSLAAVSKGDRQLLISGGEDGAVRLWDVAEQRQAIMGWHEKRVLTVSASHDGRLAASGGQDSVIHLWDLERATHVRRLATPGDWVWSTTFSRDGDWLASGGEDKTVWLWSVNSHRYRVFPGHTHAVRAVAFTANHELVSGSYDQTVRLWDARAESSASASLKSWCGQVEQLRTVAFSPDSEKLACGGSDGVIRVYSLDKGAGRPAALIGHRSYVWSVGFSPDGGELASVSDDGSLLTWDVPSANDSTSRPTYTRSFGSRVRCLAYDPNSQWLACGGNDHHVRLFRRHQKEWVQCSTLEGHTNWVWSVAFDASGQRLASASEDGTVILWDLGAGGRKLQKVTVPRSQVYSVCFSPDGQTLATGGSDSLVRLWGINASGKLECYRVLGEHTNWIWSVGFSRDGRFIATAGADCSVRLWKWAAAETALLDVVRPEEGHCNWVRTLAFSPDSKWLATAGDDAVVKLWRLESDRLIFERDFTMSKAWEDTWIDGIRGLTSAEESTLVALGARRK